MKHFTAPLIKYTFEKTRTVAAPARGVEVTGMKLIVKRVPLKTQVYGSEVFF